MLSKEKHLFFQKSKMENTKNYQKMKMMNLDKEKKERGKTQNSDYGVSN